MGLWEKFKEFDRMMSEPAIVIRIEKMIEIPDEELFQHRNENKQISSQKRKQLSYVDADYKLLK